MKKRSTLLKVMSIILIVFGVIGIISSIFIFTSKESIDQVYTMAGMEPLPTWYYVFSLVSSAVQLAAGITGVMYKSKQSVLIVGAAYCAFIILDIIIATVLTAFSFSSLFSLIIPLLYMWGWYQSE